MYPYLASEIPLVFVCNTAETFLNYMSRADRPDRRQQLIAEMRVLGDRALLHPADPKLVIISAAIAHSDLVQHQLGFTQTRHRVPVQPSPCLCEDICADGDILEAIAHHAGQGRTIQLIPHATTPQFLRLVDTLRSRCGLTVRLPESPTPENLWLRDYVDTKAGFRHLFLQAQSSLPPNVYLPEGYVAQTLEQAAAIAQWFLTRNQSCLVKADTGNDALGHTAFSPKVDRSLDTTRHQLAQNPFLHEGLIVVEAFIPSTGRLFPSVELFVPAPEEGSPEMTYVCNQLFFESGTFAGVLVSREFEAESWYQPLVEAGLAIAHHLQHLGYVGHFDLDAIVDDAGRLFCIEINARRTGGTHVHELGVHRFGKDYLHHTVLLSNTSMGSGAISDFATLRAVLEPWLFPMGDRPQGVIITHTSGLEERKFGYVLAAPTAAIALELQAQMLQALESGE